MNANRILLFSTLMAAGVCAQALAADVEFESGNGAQIRFHHVHPTVIVHQSVVHIPIGAGNTNLDKLHQITCKSASGCLITAKVYVIYSSGDCPSVSAFVDNAAMNPPGVGTCDAQAISQQSAIVSMGVHTIQAAVTQQGANGDVLGFEAEYIKYESAP